MNGQPLIQPNVFKYLLRTAENRVEKRYKDFSAYLSKRSSCLYSLRETFAHLPNEMINLGHSCHPKAEKVCARSLENDGCSSSSWDSLGTHKPVEES